MRRSGSVRWVRVWGSWGCNFQCLRPEMTWVGDDVSAARLYSFARRVTRASVVGWGGVSVPGWKQRAGTRLGICRIWITFGCVQ